MSIKRSSILIVILILVFGISSGVVYPQKADTLLSRLQQSGKIEKILNYLQLAEHIKTEHSLQAEAYVDTALLLAKRYNIDSLIYAAAYKKGAAALNQGALREAKKHLQTAYLSFKPEYDQQSYCRLLNLLGETYARQGKLDTAYTILQSSLELNLSTKDTINVARVYNKIGNVNYMSANFERALKSYRQAYEYFIMLKNNQGLATTSMNLGNLYEELGEEDTARYYYHAALRLSKNLGDYKDISVVLNNLGVFHANLENSDSAIYYLRKSSEAAQEIKDFYQIAVLKNNIGLIHKKNDEHQKALIEYNEAMDIANANNYVQLRRNLYKNLAATYANTGKFKEAYEFRIQYASLNDSVNNLETKERISNLQLEFEEKRKIEEIRAQSDLRQMRYTYTITILMAILLLVSVTLIVILRNNLHRKKVNKELLKKNIETARQKELQEATLKELSESQKKTRAILKALPDVMFIFDREGNYLDYHAKNEADVIKSEEHLLGSNVKKELSEDFANKILNGIRKAAESGQVQVLVHRDRVNQRMMDMELRIAPIKDGTFLMIGRNISERKNMERELKGARDEMQKALEAKSMYLASLSHEIRTPLTSIIGVTSILEETDLSEEQQECTNIINISGNNLLNLINNILDFSKIESGQLKLERVRLLIHEIIEEVVSLLDVKAKESNNTIRYEIDERLNASIVGDPYRLTQILINLVNNAIKFTKNGSIHINVSILEEKSSSLMLRFEVADTGIGVSIEQRDKLFKAFSQADESIARKYGGSGLGLLISKHFVELMGGEIGLDSEEGKGSKFWFTAAFNKTDISSEGGSQTQEKTEMAIETEQSGAKSILLVEDNLLNQKFAMAILQKQKHSVDIAENGKIGVEFFEKKAYDVILMDIQMPVMDGIQATKNIRKIETEKNMKPTRIVAVTAYAMEGDEEKFYQAGIDDYLRKPYKANQLLAKLEPGSKKDEDL